MCMFYNTPRQDRIRKPIKAFKIFKRNGKYPFQDQKPVKTGKWLQARAPKWGVVQNYGFHVFTSKQDALRFKQSWFPSSSYYVVREVKIRGTVYGIGDYLYPSGMRVSSLFIPKRKTKKK